MRNLMIGISLAILAIASGAGPATAQAFYFGFGYGPPRHHDGYEYYRYYRPDRRYLRRYDGPPVSYYRRRAPDWRNCEWQWGRRYCCPDGFTVQDGACKPYRGY